MRTKTQAQRLRAAMEEQRLSARTVAKRILGSNATEQEILSKKAQVTKWRNGPGGISEPNARALEAALEKPAGYLARLPGKPRTVEDELRDFRAEYHAEMQRLREDMKTEIRETINEALGKSA